MYTQYDDDGNLQLVEEPSADYTYTYADYLKWQWEERVELFKGKLMKMAAPNTAHQVISIRLSSVLFSFLDNKKCKVFHAPFDVRLPVKNKKKDNEITTVVQPDLCVVCDEKKIDRRGCCGAPDIMIEILSPGNTKKELQNKFELYEEAGVQEYWLVYPEEQCVIIYALVDGNYIGKKPFGEGSTITTIILPGLEINNRQISLNNKRTYGTSKL